MTLSSRNGASQQFSILIHQALPHLGRQQVNLNPALTSLVDAGLERIKNSVGQLENSLDDFLSGNVGEKRREKSINFLKYDRICSP